MPTNPTQAAGLAAFAASMLACAWVAWRMRRGAWAALAAVHALLLLDIALDLRHRLHDGVNALLRAAGVYDTRGGLQAVLLGAAFVALLWLAWRWRRAGAAVAATALLVALFLVEAISWHESDRLLYAHAGPLLRIAWAWVALAAVVVVSALRARR